MQASQLRIVQISKSFRISLDTITTHMRNSLGAFIILFFLSIPFYGQNQKVVDSLLQLTESGISDREKVDAFIKIAFEHVGSDSTGANFYIKKGLDIADSIGYEEGKMDALYVLGRSSLLSGKYEKSEEQLKRLLESSNQLNYNKGIANAYYGTAWLNYYKGQYDQSIELHLKSLEIRNTLGDKIDISDCLRGIGITYKLQGEFDKALRYLNQSLDIEKEINNQGGVATTLNHIGIINSLRGDYTYAMDIYFEALEIERDLGDKSGLAYTYQNIGVIYDQQKDYEKALEYYNQSLSLRKEIGERRGVAQIINNIGVVYNKLGNYAKALDNYQEALSRKEELGDKRGVADGNLNIGKLYADQGQHNQAIAYKKRSLAISNEINSDWGKVEALISLGKSYHDLKRLAVAKKYLKDGIQLARESKLVGSVRDGSKLLSEVEKDLGNYKEALDAMAMFQQMSDSISSVEIAKRITLLEAKFEFQQERDSIQFANEREKLILDQQIKSQRSTQIITWVAVVVLIIIIGILYGFYRFKNKSNKRLSQLNTEINDRNESLKALNEEKNNLIGIVAHDLQNPLAGVIGASKLMDSERLSADDKKLRSLIESNASRMSKMISDILDIEAIEENVEGINVRSYNLSEAVRDVTSQFEKQASDKNIEIRTSIEEDVNVLVDDRYVIQIIENLLSNAIKFSPAYKGVDVKLFKNQNKSILQVKDEGPGLSEQDKKKLFKKFQKLTAQPTGNESSTGLGLATVKKFVDGMKGDVWCESELGKGASFFVALRLAGHGE